MTPTGRADQQLRIATWNLERPKRRSWKIRPAQQRRMELVDADIWVLTETRVSVSPGEGYEAVHCPPHPTRREDPDERWVSIWSRWPIRPAEEVASNPRGTTVAWCETPSGPLIVYGTVLPWANEPDADGRVRMWAVHQTEIARQGEEWATLRRVYPEVPLFVAGDFNQDRDESGWYGSRTVRAALSAQLERSGLAVLTAADVVAAGLLAEHHLIDHIAAAGLPSSTRSSLSCWEVRDEEGIRMSDHPTVAIDIHPRTSTLTSAVEA